METMDGTSSSFLGGLDLALGLLERNDEDDMLGLGSVIHIVNGGMKSADYLAESRIRSIKVMYPGGIWASGNTQLQIPGFVAIASSEVPSGTPVICKGKADAIGTLIKVYLPGSSPKIRVKPFSSFIKSKEAHENFPRPKPQLLRPVHGRSRHRIGADDDVRLDYHHFSLFMGNDQSRTVMAARYALGMRAQTMEPCQRPIKSVRIFTSINLESARSITARRKMLVI